VTLEEYLQVQANRQRRTPTVAHPRSLSSSYLLTGLVVCGVCSANGKLTAMVGQTDNRRQDTHYYRCSTKIRSRGRDCIVPRVPCWRLEQAVMTLLRETVLTRECITSVVTQADALLIDTDTEVEGLLAEATRQARAAQRKVETVIELMGKKGVTSILEAQYDAANRAWLEATARVHSLKAQSTRAQSRHLSLDDAQQCLDEILTTLSSGLLPERRALIAQFVERVEVHPMHADVRLKFRLDTLTAAFDWSWSQATSQKEADSLFRSPRQVYGWCPQGDSNARTRLRRPVLYPLSYGGRLCILRTQYLRCMQHARLSVAHRATHRKESERRSSTNRRGSAAERHISEAKQSAARWLGVG